MELDFIKKNQIIHIVVIIPTKNRSELFHRALKSIINQKYKPDKIIIINQSTDSEYENTNRIIKLYKENFNIDIIKNNRTQNLSGALNSALFHIKKYNFNTSNTYIAFLDDDDYWSNDYLDTLINHSLNSDWIISGIIRYDINNPMGLKQKIFDEISINDFLIGNPNIQGSNLFLKLNILYKIDGFDETLPSTTDRDICIRLLQIEKLNYKSIKFYGVHHFAFDNYPRLSTPGSTSKSNGLNLFFKKYKSLMTKKQILDFSKRAKILFNVEIDMKNNQ